MAIKDWPELERPREKLLKHGSQTLSDAELLAILFGNGSGGKSAVDMARELINHFGCLRQLLNADYTALRKFSGLGPVKFACLQASLELGRRYIQQKITRHGTIKNAEDVKEFLMSHLRDQSQELFSALFLDNRHQIIKFETLFYGTINGASVHPREIAKKALSHNAAALIVAHNHPSGIAEPSQSDIYITEKIQQALHLLEINLLDHIIIGDGEFVSLKQRGVI